MASELCLKCPMSFLAVAISLLTAVVLRAAPTQSYSVCPKQGLSGHILEETLQEPC